MAYASFHQIFFIFLIPFCALAQNNGNVPVGSILTAREESNQWLSPSGEFAFGFQQLQDKDLFLLSIWYHKIPDKTIVWYLNSRNPVPRGSTVELVAEAGLVLRDSQGVLIWTTNGISDQADHGFMNDTGNFIIKGSDNSRLWESFRFPADTILPLQELVTGTNLSSKKSETNFSKGRFLLIFHEDGNLVLSARSVPSNTEDDVVFYNSTTSDPTSTSNFGYRLIFDHRGIISVLRRNNQTLQLSSSSDLPLASENYFRATLDFDGVFTLYYHPRNVTSNQKWTVHWSVPENSCSATAPTAFSACGYNSICNLVNGRPICECPNGYSLLDPDDRYGSCISNFTNSCGEVESDSAGKLYDFVVLNQTDWPFSDYGYISPSSEAGCREACLQDCFCAVAIFGLNSCWKKKLPLSNGMRGDYVNRIAFLKYRKRDAPPIH